MIKKQDSSLWVLFLTKCFRKIKGKSASEIWSNLLEKYEERNAQGINFLRRKFLNIKKEKSESVESFINKLIIIKEELEAAESAVSDEDTVMTLIQGISSNYENYVQCMIAGKKSYDLDLVDILDN